MTQTEIEIQKKELSLKFDILYNNTTSNQAPDLNEYEKSVFLSKAANEVVKNHLVANGNPRVAGVDQSPKRHIDFSKLIETKNHLNKLEDALYILEETVDEVDNTDTTGSSKKKLVVIPISYTEYQRILSRPYPYPLKNQAWRIIESASEGDENLIVHPGKTAESYVVRYIKKPNPIILYKGEDYTEDGSTLTIDGYPKLENNSYTYPALDLPLELYDEVLQRAVELAKIAWQGDLSATLTGGQRSE